MSTTRRLLTAVAVMAIMNKRSLVKSSHVGRKVVLTIQGDGNTIDVVDKEGNEVLSTIAGQEGTVLQKRIFNAKANSEIAMQNPRNREMLKAGIAAAKAGDHAKADECFSKYLNAVQISIGILLPSATADALANGVDIAANVQLVTTENGSLLTVDSSTISVKQPELLGGTTFSIEEDEEEETETPEQLKVRLAAEKKAAKKTA